VPTTPSAWSEFTTTCPSATDRVDDNLDAIALYESFGFEIEGTMPAYVWRKGAYIDAHVMGRVLPSAR
jgi:L-amino acid N-acyltransferase YncA